MSDRLTKILRAVSAAAPESRYIRAYHGSPYDWNKVDMSKIGTGEGAAAYGHGFYASQAEPVADWYRRELSGPPDIFIGGELVTKGSRLSSASPRERALWLLDRAAFRYPDPMEALRDAVLDASDTFGGGGRDHVQPIIDSLMRFKSAGVKFGPRKGKTYELEIGYPEEALLDWDAPVHKQPDSIYDALGWSANPSLSNTMGRDWWRGQNAYYKMAEEFGGSDKAAQRLREAGIPGIRYLDQSSRAAGEGTRNYVMFPGTEDSIRILRKYGLLAPIPAAAAMSGEQ